MEILHNHDLQEEYFFIQIQQLPKQTLFHIYHHGTKS